MITVYTVTYNEEIMIQFMIDHYRTRFPNCHIVVHDNMSTDDTVKIALANGCEIIPYDSGGQHRERSLIDIKNNSWKEAKTDWVLACDLDELLDINTAELKTEEESGTTVIRTEGYNMVALDDNLDIAGMKYGERDEGEDKSCPPEQMPICRRPPRWIIRLVMNQVEYSGQISKRYNSAGNQE